MRYAKNAKLKEKIFGFINESKYSYDAIDYNIYFDYNDIDYAVVITAAGFGSEWVYICDKEGSNLSSEDVCNMLNRLGHSIGDEYYDDGGSGYFHMCQDYTVGEIKTAIMSKIIKERYG